MKKIFMAVAIVVVAAVMSVGSISNAGGVEIVESNKPTIRIVLTWDNPTDTREVCEWYGIYYSKKLIEIYNRKVESFVKWELGSANETCVDIKKDDFEDYFFIGVTRYIKDKGYSNPVIAYHLYGDFGTKSGAPVPVWEAEVNDVDAEGVAKYFGMEVPKGMTCKEAADSSRSTNAAGIAKYDLNKDGVIDAKDRDIVLSRKGKRVPPCSYLPMFCESCAKNLNCEDK